MSHLYQSQFDFGMEDPVGFGKAGARWTSGHLPRTSEAGNTCASKADMERQRHLLEDGTLCITDKEGVDHFYSPRARDRLTAERLMAAIARDGDLEALPSHVREEKK